MLARYICPNCDQWHHLAEMPTPVLIAALRAFMREPPPPFSGYEWACIISAEITKRNRASSN